MPRSQDPDSSTAPPRVCASRRRALSAAGALFAAPFVVTSKRAPAAGLRTLAFRHTHTGEALTVAYASGDSYAAAALARVDWFLRDFRTGETKPIDPQLLDQLHALSSATGSRAPFDVISGYRSPATNLALQRSGGGGVASHSLHLEGRAIDIRLADVPLADLRDAALSMRAGGVGFYPDPQFVHLDTGRVRRW
jgi:uncharacterized protein YcbK (DUF882 family)